MSTTHCRVLPGQILGRGPAGAPVDIPEVRAGVAGNDEAPAAASKVCSQEE